MELQYRNLMAYSMRFSIVEDERDLTIGSAYLPFDNKEPLPTKEEARRRNATIDRNNTRVYRELQLGTL